MNCTNNIKIFCQRMNECRTQNSGMNRRRLTFKTKANEWIHVVSPPSEKDNEIGPKDSISLVSQGSKSSKSSSSSARLVAQAEKAALLAKAAALKERHALEEKEERLAKEREEIRRQKETLDFEAELSAANAKLAVLSSAVEQVAASTPADGMNDYLEERNTARSGLHNQLA